MLENQDVTEGRARVAAVSERLETAGVLQRPLIDVIDLTMQAKQAYWNVNGHHFRSVQLQLDALVHLGRQYSDCLAERCVALGEVADGRAGSVVADANLEPFPSGRSDDKRVVQLIAERFRAVSEVGQRLEQLDPVRKAWFAKCSGSLRGNYGCLSSRRLGCSLQPNVVPDPKDVFQEDNLYD
jgi:starvation-inducible DNA-binding protein